MNKKFLLIYLLLCFVKNGFAAYDPRLLHRQHVAASKNNQILESDFEDSDKESGKEDAPYGAHESLKVEMVKGAFEQLQDRADSGSPRSHVAVSHILDVTEEHIKDLQENMAVEFFRNRNIQFTSSARTSSSYSSSNNNNKPLCKASDSQSGAGPSSGDDHLFI